MQISKVANSKLCTSLKLAATDLQMYIQKWIAQVDL